MVTLVRTGVKANCAFTQFAEQGDIGDAATEKSYLSGEGAVWRSPEELEFLGVCAAGAVGVFL